MKKQATRETKDLNELVSIFERRDYDQSLLLAQKFTKKYPNNGTGWNLLGLSHKSCGQIAEAEAVFEFLTKLSPDTAMYHSNLGNCRQMTGKIVESIACFEKAVSLDPKLVNAVEALGLSYMELNEQAQAKSCFERVIEIDPENGRSLYFLGNLLLIDRRWSEAAKYLKRSNFGLSQSHYLECLLCMKKGKEFLQFYQQLDSKGVTNPLIGGLVAHVQELYKREVNNSFCNNALEYLHVGQITEHDGFSDSLAEDLLNYHRQARHDYRSQSLLHNGEQSSGNLFVLNQPFARELKRCIVSQIENYRIRFKGKNEGFLRRWPDRYELFGWLVSMRQGGNLDSHNHKEGWLSGSFYLKVPETQNGKTDEGKIAFSYKGPRYPSDGHKSRRRVVDIKTRDICMFPSSLFHETLPFHSNEERVSFAFDVLPKG